jgi:nitrate reductase gamma subunit
MKPSAFVNLPGLAAGIGTVLLLGLGILLGSRNLRNYDPALLIYTFGTLFAAFAVAYRYAVWLQRPPTRVYWRRGWQLLCQRGKRSGNLLTLLRALGGNFIAQNFIRRRGRSRWIAHFCLSWGTIMAGAVTFPLVFGWLHFESRLDDPQMYQVLLFGIQVGAFHTTSMLRYVLFNLLNVSAVLVLIGVLMILHRRLHDAGAVAGQQFGTDFVPLLLLLAVATTGLMLTFSMHALHGDGFVVISLIHAATVIAMLLYLPFGKLFHIFQRPLHLSVTLYKHTNETAPAAVCRICGAGFAGAMHVEDLKTVLHDVGLDWRLNGTGAHYMNVCPPCRRRQVGIWHGRVMAGTQSQHRDDTPIHNMLSLIR